MINKDFFKNSSFPNISILLFLLAVGAFLLFYNLNNYYLWSDEGETACYARNILKFGLPYGFDGRNAFFLNKSMLPILEPWFVLYAAALSLKLFGDNGIRILFAFLGLAAMFMQYVFVCHFYNNKKPALINLLLIVTSVQYLLFARQCRYYSMVMLLAPAIGYFYFSYKDRWWEVILAAMLFTVFFFSNYIIAVAFLFSLAISLFLFDNRSKAVYFFLKPLPIIAVICGGFFYWLYQNGWMDANPYLLRNIHPANFMQMIWLYFKDYNLLQLLPFGIIISLLAVLIWEAWLQKKAFLETNRKTLSLLFFIILYTVVISILSTAPVQDNHSAIRYATAIFPTLLLIQAVFVEKIYNLRKWAAYILLFVLIFTNLFTFLPMRSYVFEFVRENSRPLDNPAKVAINFLETRVRQDDLIYIAQPLMIGSMEFYLGDKLLFCSIADVKDENVIPEAIRQKQYIYSQNVVPDWIVFFGSLVKPENKRFIEKIKLADYQIHFLPVFGFDLTRPEIYWRSFVPVKQFSPEDSLYILERKKGKSRD
jgi:hypothetical protein